eukprot:4466026-Pleurochrysis_carterae.AAC.4
MVACVRMDILYLISCAAVRLHGQAFEWHVVSGCAHACVFHCMHVRFSFVASVCRRACSSRFVVSRLPLFAAWWSGVMPLASATAASALADSSCDTTLSCASLAAHASAVRPSSST